MLLDQAFQRELYRHLRLEGFDPEFSSRGRVTLPDMLPKKTLLRLSKAKTAIDAAEAAGEPKPSEISRSSAGLSREGYRNRLNDRIRPAKTPFGDMPPLPSLLLPEESRRLTGWLRDRRDPNTNAEPKKTTEDDAHRLRLEIDRSLRERYLFTTSKIKLRSVIAVAREWAEIPLHWFFTQTKEWSLGPRTPKIKPKGTLPLLDIIKRRELVTKKKGRRKRLRLARTRDSRVKAAILRARVGLDPIRGQKRPLKRSGRGNSGDAIEVLRRRRWLVDSGMTKAPSEALPVVKADREVLSATRGNRPQARRQ